MTKMMLGVVTAAMVLSLAACDDKKAATPDPAASGKPAAVAPGSAAAAPAKPAEKGGW